MDMIKQYFDNIHTLLGTVLDTQSDSIARAVKAVADTLERGGTVYAFGTGHSHMLAEELFYRAGGLVKVFPILDDGLMLHTSASRSSELERLPGYADTLLAGGISPREGDTIFIFSNSGRNAVPVEMALAMKKRGVATLCITNIAQSSQAKSRHSSGLRLFEICDIVIDNCGAVGDAAISLGEYRCGPTSTVIGAAILQAIVCGVVDRLQQQGGTPEVFCSSNMDGGDAVNEQWIRQYRKEIPML
jgi:uncharacterized phosphosugar-binding protein